MKILKDKIKTLDKKLTNPYKELIKSYPIAETFNEIPLGKEIIVEIGSGSGNFLNSFAKQEQDKTFIGLELRYKRLVCSAQKSKDLELENIFWMKKNAKEINEIFPENSISEIYILFPDPWTKKIKNRLFQTTFLERAFSVLKKNGKIHFKTDNDEYFRFAKSFCKNIIFETTDLYKDKEIGLASEFENLFYHQKKNINYLILENR